jgi:hypothetical protein
VYVSVCVLVVCYLEASTKTEGEKKEKIIHTKAVMKIFVRQIHRVNFLVFDITDVMNDQIMDGMIMV